jgi:hypothetical protein
LIATIGPKHFAYHAFPNYHGPDQYTTLRRAKVFVARARQIVEEQYERMTRLYAHGHPMKSHEALLAQFERTLATLEDHELLLRRGVD